jgi:hypothetical protein
VLHAKHKLKQTQLVAGWQEMCPHAHWALAPPHTQARQSHGSPAQPRSSKQRSQLIDRHYPQTATIAPTTHPSCWVAGSTSHKVLGTHHVITPQGRGTHMPGRPLRRPRAANHALCSRRTQPRLRIAARRQRACQGCMLCWRYTHTHIICTSAAQVGAPRGALLLVHTASAPAWRPSSSQQPPLLPFRCAMIPSLHSSLFA